MMRARSRRVAPSASNDRTTSFGVLAPGVPARCLNAYTDPMVAVTVSDIEQDLPVYLRRVEAGETVVVLRDGRPIAEIRPVAVDLQQPRPYGLAADEFTTPDDFDEPLPDDIIAAFEGR
jgi:antitoxin (DNA-binding transcriptional repressor) of toxin-antitoxin stability system